MSTPFSVIVDDFESALTPLQEIVKGGQSNSSSPKARVASVRAATLLLAATFEEFIREMAKELAIQVVKGANCVADLPDALLETAWRRTFELFARRSRTGHSRTRQLEELAKQARPKVYALCAFIEGDISQNIFDNLIHNENNMRAAEINRLFKVGGFENACRNACKQEELKSFFETMDDGRAHGELLDALNGFFRRRNEIAHSLNTASSSAPETLIRDMELFRAFSKDLCTALEARCP